MQQSGGMVRRPSSCANPVRSVVVTALAARLPRVRLRRSLYLQSLLDAMAVLDMPAFLLPQLHQRLAEGRQHQQQQQQPAGLDRQQQPEAAAATGAPTQHAGEKAVEPEEHAPSTPGASAFASCSLSQQLSVLSQIHRQLTSRLGGLTHYPPTRDGADASDGGSTLGHPGDCNGAALVTDHSNPTHARMARLYVRRQGQILEAACQAVRAKALELLTACRPPPAPCATKPQPAGTSAGTASAAQTTAADDAAAASATASSTSAAPASSSAELVGGGAKEALQAYRPLNQYRTGKVPYNYVHNKFPFLQRKADLSVLFPFYHSQKF